MLAGQQKGRAPASLRLPGTRPYTRAILFRVRPCGFRASGVGAFRARAPSHSEVPRQKAPQWPRRRQLTPKRLLWLKHRCLCEAINGSRPPPSPLSFLPFARMRARALSLSLSRSFSLFLPLSLALSLALPQAALSLSLSLALSPSFSLSLSLSLSNQHDSHRRRHASPRGFHHRTK